MDKYIDYGIIIPNNSTSRITPKVKTTQPKTQVYRATHVGDEVTRLPYMERSFISFTFGGKHIEDFGFIAYTEGDRMSRGAYADFEDLTTDYEVLNGHFYWGTHHTDHELELNLATDGVTQQQIDEFRRWFAPGKIRELILSEHPNRAIQARVSEPPEFNFLPFEQPTIVNIGVGSYQTSTTLYKGEVTLTFVMDAPYWYGKLALLGRQNGLIYEDTWIDANGNRVNIFDDPDAMKILLEDGIPALKMITTSMMLGNGTYIDMSGTGDMGRLVNDEEEQYVSDSSLWININRVARIYDEANISIAYARIDGASVIGNSNGIQHLSPKWNSGIKNLYYAGTAPSEPVIKFTLTPYIRNNGGSPKGYYVANPSNTYDQSVRTNGESAADGDTFVGIPYNTLSLVGPEDTKQFRFTTPGLYTSFNQAMDIFVQAQNAVKKTEWSVSWADIKEYIRDRVGHPAVREWANKVVDFMVNSDNIGWGNNNANPATRTVGTIDRSAAYPKQICYKDSEGDWNQNNDTQDWAHKLMMLFLLPKDPTGFYGSEARDWPYGTFYYCMPADFTIDSKTGSAKAIVRYRNLDFTLPQSLMDWENIGASSDLNNLEHEEEVGDMILSNYIIIEGRNYPIVNSLTDQLEIKARSSINPSASYEVYHNVTNGLDNFSIEYRNMYY